MRGSIPFFVSALSLAALTGCSTMRSPSRLDAPELPPSDGIERHISYTAGLTVAVRDIPKSVSAAQQVLRDAGGQVDRQSLGDVRAYLHARVPPERFRQALTELEKLGDVRDRQVGQEDLTDQIVDVQARRKNLESLRDRLRGLLDRAEKIEDVLAIEHELTRVQSELDSMAARIAVLDERVQWSQVDLTLERKMVPGPVGFVVQWAWRAIEKLFVWRPGA